MRILIVYLTRSFCQASWNNLKLLVKDKNKLTGLHKTLYSTIAAPDVGVIKWLVAHESQRDRSFTILRRN
jgi:hypothetical protein